MRKTIDNGQFGSWTILEKIRRGPKHYCWKCQCSCGAIKIVYSLKSSFERCQHCKQNTKTEIVIGAEFNQWVVIGKTRVNNRKRWQCRCRCGREGAVSSHALITKSSTRCRTCAHQEMQLNGKMSYQRYFNILKSARIRGIPFSDSLTREYLECLFDRQNSICAISGMPIKFANSSKTVKKGGDTASLDRIDSDKPYEIGNVHWVHKIINIMKGRLDADEFIKWCRQVVAHCDGQTNSNKPCETTTGWLFGTRTTQ